ncbi:MAG: type II secretion system secretin GspD [Pseudomonadota bacterium]
MRLGAFIAVAVLSLGIPLSYAQPKLPRTAGLVNLDFHDVDIQDVAKSISEITGKNFLLDDRVRGKVTIISPSPMTVEEAYQAFLSALKLKNLCAVDVGNITQILPSRECKENAITTEGDKEVLTGDQPITKIIALKYINANEIKQALNPLVSKNGTIVAYGPTNSLMITDAASNIQRLVKIIDKLDKQSFQSSVELVPLKHASATDIADKLNMIFAQEKAGAGRSRRGNDVEAGANVSKIIPDVRTNSLIVVATREGLERTLDLLSELDKPVEFKLEQNRVHVKKLSHADATELAGIMNALLTGATTAKKKTQKAQQPSQGSQQPGQGGYGTEPLPWEEETQQPAAPPIASEGGAIVRNAGGMFQDEVRIVADPATNSLVVTASPVDYTTLEPIIDQLDQRRPQVFVEALIMEVTLDKTVAVGLSGHGGAANGTGMAYGMSHLGALTPAILGQNPAALADPAHPVGLVLGGQTTKTFQIGNIKLPWDGATFHALQTNNIINVLSAPNILTTDNKRAEIVIADKVPFRSSSTLVGTGASQQSITREDVGIKLFVTPKIADINEVTLEVEQHIQEVKDFKGAADIGSTERSAKTTVVAQSGQTIVIGGLIQDREENGVSKVPLLGDIPLVGYLFRDTSVVKKKINLVLFLTPTIIRDPMDLTRISVKKNNERRRFNKSQGIGENKALYDYDLDKGLNMAPPVPSTKASPGVKTEKRFDYDKPNVDQEQQNSDEQDLAARRRMPRRNQPKIDYAEQQDDAADTADVPRTKRGSRKPSSGGNPFSDVRPPTSAQ